MALGDGPLSGQDGGRRTRNLRGERTGLVGPAAATKEQKCHAHEATVHDWPGR
jgi:hypothetical protein